LRPALARLAGFPDEQEEVASHEVEAKTQKKSESQYPLVDIPEDLVSEKHSCGDSDVPAESGDHEGASSVRDDSNSENIDHPTRASNLGSRSEVSDKFGRLQLEAWGNRMRKHKRHARIAIFQFDVDETYRHPIFEVCKSDESTDFGKVVCGLSRRKRLCEWEEDADLMSCAEKRRRRMLRKVMAACKAFEVDILLLPEYSVRTETVEWIRDVIDEISPCTSIWAGTLRLAPGGRGFHRDKERRDWAAYLPVILPSDGSGGKSSIEFRRKKYPAIAVEEVILPTIDPLKPIFGEKKIAGFDPRAYVLELICSELFLLTSPANHLSLRDALAALRRKFGIGKPVDNLESVITKDLMELANLTSLSGSKNEPRLIHLIPAMTRRAADYHVAGQASFLAGGITTVFCNASDSKFSRGESCFIGYGGWWKDKIDETGFPTYGPYHGVKPGLFDPFGKNRGLLEKSEQAVIIADIDPVYAIEGNPRPQMLPCPLSVVAHLPIIETVEKETQCCSCKRKMGEKGRIIDSMRQILEITKKQKNGEYFKAAVNEMGAALKSLAELWPEDRAYWLRERSKAFSDSHAVDPVFGVLPAAIDWIWVDNSTDECGKIHVPPYSVDAHRNAN